MLLGLLLPTEPALDTLRPSLNILSSHAVEVRYPGESATKAQALEAVSHCRLVRSTLRGSLGLAREKKSAKPRKHRTLNLWRFYNDRAGIELIIRQLKGDYALGKIPGRHFSANETYFHLLLLAYNLVNWFRRLCLPAEFRHVTLQTLRNQILFMPAQLLRTGHRPRLALPASGSREVAWKHALHRIERLKL